MLTLKEIIKKTYSGEIEWQKLDADYPSFRAYYEDYHIWVRWGARLHGYGVRLRDMISYDNSRKQDKGLPHLYESFTLRWYHFRFKKYLLENYTSFFHN